MSENLCKNVDPKNFLWTRGVFHLTEIAEILLENQMEHVNFRNAVSKISKIHLIFKQDFRNFRQMESALGSQVPRTRFPFAVSITLPSTHYFSSRPCWMSSTTMLTELKRLTKLARHSCTIRTSRAPSKEPF
jgi:hypothetical protein